MVSFTTVVPTPVPTMTMSHTMEPALSYSVRIERQSPGGPLPTRNSQADVTRGSRESAISVVHVRSRSGGMSSSP